MIKPPGSSSRLTCILCIFSFACPGCSSSCRQNSCPSKNGEQQGWEPPLPSQILSEYKFQLILCRIVCTNSEPSIVTQTPKLKSQCFLYLNRLTRTLMANFSLNLPRRQKPHYPFYIKNSIR